MAFLLISLAAFGGVIFGLVRGIADAKHALIWPMFFLLFPVAGCTVGALAMLGEETDPEKVIEGELQGCVRKRNET